MCSVSRPSLQPGLLTLTAIKESLGRCDQRRPERQLIEVQSCPPVRRKAGSPLLRLLPRGTNGQTRPSAASQLLETVAAKLT